MKILLFILHFQMQFLQHICFLILLLGPLKISIYFLQFYCKEYALSSDKGNWGSHFMLAAVLKLLVMFLPFSP